MAPDSASRSPFRLVSTSFCHVSVILPCILSYLLLSEHFLALWFIVDFLCLSPGIGHPGSFSWGMVSRAEICVLMCVRCYWHIAVPRPFQWTELGNVCVYIYTHIYTYTSLFQYLYILKTMSSHQYLKFQSNTVEPILDSSLSMFSPLHLQH